MTSAGIATHFAQQSAGFCTSAFHHYFGPNVLGRKISYTRPCTFCEHRAAEEVQMLNAMTSPLVMGVLWPDRDRGRRLYDITH